MVKSQHLLAIIFITKEIDYSFGPAFSTVCSWKENEEGDKTFDVLYIFHNYPIHT